MLGSNTYITRCQTASMPLDSGKNSYILSTMLREIVMFKKRDTNVFKPGLDYFLLRLNEVKLTNPKGEACREAIRLFQ
jgi:hypothetical protein